MNSVATGIKLSDLVPKPDERTAVIGMSGSGKSYLCRRLLSQCGTDIVIIDPKNQFDYSGALIVDTPKKFRTVKKLPVIYRPHPADLMEQSQYNEVCQLCFERGNITLYIDDLVGIVSPTRYPHYLGVCYMMGRSRNVRVISAFQRPSRLPLFTMSEANRFFAFKLNLRDDVKRIQEFVPAYDPTALKRKHTFFFQDVNDNEPAKELYL